MRHWGFDSTLKTMNDDIIRARQGRLPYDKYEFVEYEVCGWWRRDMDCDGTNDTHFISYRDMLKQLGVGKAQRARRAFESEYNQSVEDIEAEALAEAEAEYDAAAPAVEPAAADADA